MPSVHQDSLPAALFSRGLDPFQCQRTSRTHCLKRGCQRSLRVGCLLNSWQCRPWRWS